MIDIILYLTVTIIGYFIGTRLRKIESEFKWLAPVQSASTCFLLFFMGTRIGSNREVVENLGTIGLQSFSVTIVIFITTILTLSIARRLMGFNKYGELKSKEEIKENIKSPKETNEERKSNGFDAMTFLIIGFVILGILAGHFFVRKIFTNYDTFELTSSILIKVGLCSLLVFVGIDLGIEGTVVANFKKSGIRIIIFPFITCLGALIGGLVSFLIIPLTLKESLAVSSGMAWYSLAPIIILDAGHVTASAISFLHNVMRELIAVIIVPFVAKYVGYIEATGTPGAPGMDICLPVVERSTNSTMAIYTFISGVICSLLVPVLVPLFIN